MVAEGTLAFPSPDFQSGIILTYNTQAIKIISVLKLPTNIMGDHVSSALTIS